MFRAQRKILTLPPAAKYTLAVALATSFAALVVSCSLSTDVTQHTESKSRMLSEVVRNFKPVEGDETKGTGHIAGFFDDVVSFLGDVADVVLADFEGAAKGAGVGAGVGTMIYGPEDVESVRGAAIAGAVVYGAAASIGKIDEKINGDSLVHTSGSPYNSGFPPNSPDSSAWLHNNAVVSIVNARVGNPNLTIRDGLRNYFVTGRGWSAQLVDSLLAINRFQSVMNDVESTTSHSQMISSLANAGLTVEAAQIDSLYNDLVYLEQNNYTNAAAVALFTAYKSNVANLAISTSRKDDFVRALAIYEYAYVLYAENEPNW